MKAPKTTVFVSLETAKTYANWVDQDSHDYDLRQTGAHEYTVYVDSDTCWTKGYRVDSNL